MGLDLGTKMRREREKKKTNISTGSKILSPNTNLQHITRWNEKLLFNKSVQNALLGMILNNPTPTHLEVYR